MFPQLLIVFSLASHINGFALDVSKNSIPNPNVKDLLTSRIVGGVDAPTEYATHMVALVSGEMITALVCGGSIISKKHILTAAHCIEPFVVWGELLPSFRGYIGSVHWNSKGTPVKFTGHLVHKDWNWATLKNDIGVLSTLDIKFSHRVKAIPLNFNWVGGDQRSFVVGWGTVGFMLEVPDRLQLLYVSTLDPDVCEAHVEKLQTQGWWSPSVDRNLEICTLLSRGFGMCHGDSGSPLILEDLFEQVGVVSWGFPCALGSPDMFVRISAYRDFLLPIIGAHL